MTRPSDSLSKAVRRLSRQLKYCIFISFNREKLVKKVFYRLLGPQAKIQT